MKDKAREYRSNYSIEGKAMTSDELDQCMADFAETLRYLDGKEVEKPEILSKNYKGDYIELEYNINTLERWNKALTPSQEIERLRKELLFNAVTVLPDKDRQLDEKDKRIKELEEEKREQVNTDILNTAEIKTLKEENERYKKLLEGYHPTSYVGTVYELQASQASEKKLREGIEKFLNIHRSEELRPLGLSELEQLITPKDNKDEPNN